MDKIELKIIGLSYSQTQSGAYALVLSEKDGARRLPIIIGGFEAQSIAIELENMKPSRPLTHDLFKSFAEAFKVAIKEVVIYNLIEGVFYSKLICDQNGEEVEIDARTSDAIAIGIRCDCPVYTFEHILSSAGIQLEEEMDEVKSIGDEDETEEPKEAAPKARGNELSALTEEELNRMLQDALDQENYERASEIRDELNKRN
ncbi:bifunctional nuclease family protein [Paracrocinitomix mangrovi]|uniref:bifunctional nuclease family protein n=1 Tax=Paracrocinitomix mangrovi TaxID=2862509 RepID=UPI001C8D75D3|nr:bifunctional nuclease family protein [Paracrocinitomix mangrovi]UKN00507.1 bifunctional nuclease family protein [Paracrocinitomix mangrovi]